MALEFNLQKGQHCNVHLEYTIHKLSQVNLTAARVISYPGDINCQRAWMVGSPVESYHWEDLRTANIAVEL